MTSKTEISKLVIILIGRLFPVSDNSEIMEINDCEIETNEINHQDMNSANEDGHINQPEDLICESNKSSQLFGGHYNEKF